jgi:plastocyanin
MRSKRCVLLGAIGVAALSFAVMLEHPSVRAEGSPATVEIDNFAFAPTTLTVAAGTTVTWKNDDADVHTVVEKDRKFKSSALDTDDTFSQTFTAPGEYEYFCSLHPRMVGKIVVKAAGS